MTQLDQEDPKIEKKISPREILKVIFAFYIARAYKGRHADPDTLAFLERVLFKTQAVQERPSMSGDSTRLPR